MLGNAAQGGDVERAVGALRGVAPAAAWRCCACTGAGTRRRMPWTAIGAVCAQRGIPLLALSADGVADPDLDFAQQRPP